MLLRARAVLPITRPPIDDGAVWASGNRIRSVGRWRDLTIPAGEPVVDLGDSILLPGLVNAHCHLDYTDMAGEIVPTRLFTDWIKTITTAKSGKIYADFAQSWLRGAQMLVRTGTTTVADIEAVPELLPEVWLATPLRVFSFLELTGVKSRREPGLILGEAVQKIESLSVSRGGVGISPHAPYSTMPELLRLSATKAREKGWRLVTHVAESDLEFEMFLHARGEMFDWLQRNERVMSDCGQGSPVRHLERNGYLADNLLAVHVNYLAPGDAALLGQRGVSVAHCPRSHAFFQHRRFPREELAGVGLNLCLGTDSLASVRKSRGQPLELNLFAEMQAFAAAHPDVPPEGIVRMVTLHGARALGLEGQIGELAENLRADIIAVPFSGKAAEMFDAVVQHRGEVAVSMIDGEWAIAPRGA
jgi:cytosine/adenosine deaminase-related metal-dependent hydrolase